MSSQATAKKWSSPVFPSMQLSWILCFRPVSVTSGTPRGIPAVAVRDSGRPAPTAEVHRQMIFRVTVTVW